MKWINCTDKLPQLDLTKIILKCITTEGIVDVFKVGGISEIYTIASRYKECWWLDEKADEDLVERVKFLDNALCTAIIFISNPPRKIDVKDKEISDYFNKVKKKKI